MNTSPWIDILVLLDPATLSLDVQPPDRPVPYGHPVRWRFRQRTALGSAGPLPEGWSPMLSFAADDSPQPSSAYGPFESLLQVATPAPDGGVYFDVVGEWATTAPAAGRHAYHAVLHRGLGFGPGKAFSLLATPALPFVVGDAGPALYTAPPVPDRHHVRLEVGEDPANAHRLVIAPSSPVRAFTDSTVTWSFASSFHRVHPLILFYHFTAAAERDDRRCNRHFEPYSRMRLRRTAVEAWDFKTRKGSSFYEAALVTERELALSFLSTGDPQLDTEGIPFPTRHGSA